MKRVLSFTLNGDPIEVVCKDNMTLLDLLRDKLGLTGTKKGCERASVARAPSCLTESPSTAAVRWLWSAKDATS